MTTKRIILSAITLWAFTLLSAQNVSYYTSTANNIETLRVRYWSDAQSDERIDPRRPHLVLPAEGKIDGTDPNNTLEISFDEMSHDAHQYSYQLLHLNANSQKSDLSEIDYIYGFTHGDITSSELSINTSRDYTHYSFQFPNEDMQITHSGLYALRIYPSESDPEEECVAVVCFAVVEERTDINLSVNSNTPIEVAGRFQQVDIEVDTRRLNYKNANEVWILVRQNERIDNQTFIKHATFVETNKLRYSNHSQLVFEGGCEYHHFDTYSTYFAGTNVDYIRYENGDYHALLMPDQIDKTGNYMHTFDTDGQRVVNAERTDYDDTEAEYMWVHWVLYNNEPILDGSIYVAGDVFNNQFIPIRNRMIYDYTNQCYYLNALVKQGGVDYQYQLVRKGETKATLLHTEGSHWQTDNTYSVYVFYRPFGARADELVGYYSSSSK